MHLPRLFFLLALLGSSSVLHAQEVVPVTDAPMTAPVPEPAQEPDIPLNVVERMPEFPGGEQAMFTYLGRELKYPTEALERGIEGAVVIQFVVERDGSIGEVKVLRGIGGGCDEEAVRVVQGMPRWSPGEQGGKKVRTSFTLPIRFQLQNKKKSKR